MQERKTQKCLKCSKSEHLHGFNKGGRKSAKNEMSTYSIKLLFFLLLLLLLHVAQRIKIPPL